MNNDQLLKTLLEEVKQRQNQETLSSTQYNIFYALRIWTKEVTLHSRIITDLLRPDGYHQMGAHPMELFIEQLSGIYKVSFDCQNSVEVVDEKGAGGSRRVDIFLKDKNGQVIIIENKIYAGDQPDQLVDYCKFGHEESLNNHNPLIIYLTLSGSQPSSNSAGDLKCGEHYHCCSYDKLIKPWIENVIEATQNRALTEVLKQYIQVIDYLTKTNMENLSNICQYIETDEDYNALQELAHTINDAPNQIANVFFEKLKAELQEFGNDESSNILWIPLEKGETTGLRDWFMIKRSGNCFWAAFTVCKNNASGVYLNEEPERLERFKGLNDQGAVTIDEKSEVYWWWLSDIWGKEYDFTSPTLTTIRDVLSKDPQCVSNLAANIKTLINKYRDLK